MVLNREKKSGNKLYSENMKFAFDFGYNPCNKCIIVTIEYITTGYEHPYAGGPDAAHYGY
jgi:hypothetical protein